MHQETRRKREAPDGVLGALTVVLVRPTGPANVGSIARIMANFGADSLRLVEPKHPPQHADSVAYATHGAHILERAEIYPTLDAALHGCSRAYATSARDGLTRRQLQLTLPEAAERARALLQLPSHAVERVECARTAPADVSERSAARMALVFGPERTGLETSDLERVDGVILIDSEPTCPVLNLAAAVTVCLYAFRQSLLDDRVDPSDQAVTVNDQLADVERRAAIEQRLTELLSRSGFYNDLTPDRVRLALRQTLTPAGLTVAQADVLLGMLRHLERCVTPTDQ